MASTIKSKITRMNADITVIGGGGAGLAAAVSAAESGVKNILLLEKRGPLGGNTALSVGLFGAESPVQKRACIDARCDYLFKTLMEFAHWKINPKIVRAFLNKSGETIGWLQNKGIKFELMPMYPNQMPPTWHAPSGRNAEIIRVLAKECENRGVKILNKTGAQKLLTTKSGEISVVVASREDEEIEIISKAVIIATGGFGGNTELLKKYCPDYHENMKCGGLPHTGDGLIMAMEIGAATEGLGLLLLSGPQIHGSVLLKLGEKSDEMIVPLMAIALDANTVWVNKKGERFADEASSYHHFISSYAVNRQPDNICYVLLDQGLVQYFTENGITIGLGYYHYEDQRTKLPGFERELRRLADRGFINIANDWTKMGKWIGAKPETLIETIREYNTDCDKGRDSIMAKDIRYLLPLKTPPYYAIKADSSFLDTIGGIKINEKMEVLNKIYDWIPGLFAAGLVTGGWEADAYCDTLSGTTSAFAINSGRIAGENASKYVKMLNT